MKKIIVAVIAFFALNSSFAQNLGQRYDWLKNSYLRIPTQAGLPFYDTLVKYGNLFSENQVLENAGKYFKTNTTKFDSVAIEENKIISRGTYTLYTDKSKDEEHTYQVKYIMELSVKSGKYNVSMRDFEIIFLTNKVDFQSKVRHAKEQEGKANYFMAIFNDQNNLELKRIHSAIYGTANDEKATASN